MVSSDRLMPGETGGIRIAVDIRGKMGNVTKTVEVHTNDPEKPISLLSVRLYIKDRIHMIQYKANGIFEDPCKSCHVDQGKGKKGWDLFKADCFMCHNAGKNTSLSQMSKMPEKHLWKVIREGIDNTVMPGWDSVNGGPLNDHEIQSLIEVIKN